MGAPAGHPFFGNQYTSGGYEPGSFSYKNVIPRVAASPITEPLGQAPIKVPVQQLLSAGKRVLPGWIPPYTAVAAAALIGGAAALTYLRSRSATAPEHSSEPGAATGAARCESCGRDMMGSCHTRAGDRAHRDLGLCENCSTIGRSSPPEMRRGQNRSHPGKGDSYGV